MDATNWPNALDVTREDPAAFAALLEAEAGGRRSLIEVPDHLVRFAAPPVSVSKKDEKGARKFEIVANSGKPFAHPWWGQFAIDFDGMKIPKQKMGVLAEHSSADRLGVTSEIEVEGRGLVARGAFLTNAAAQAVLADHDEGFPFEASVFVPATRIEFVPEGVETKVNGHVLKGPGHIFRESVLREITIAALGADSETSAVALSSAGQTIAIPKPRKETETMSEKKTEPTTATATVQPAASAMDPTKAVQLTADTLRANHPDLIRSLEAGAFKLGAQSERDRVVEILEACHDRQISKATELIKSGAEVKAAFKALLEDQSSFRANKLGELKSGNDNEPSGTSPREKQGEGKVKTTTEGASLSVDERAKLEFSQDAAIRAEFDSAASYAAFLKATEAGLVDRKGGAK